MNYTPDTVEEPLLRDLFSYTIKALFVRPRTSYCCFALQTKCLQLIKSSWNICGYGVTSKITSDLLHHPGFQGAL